MTPTDSICESQANISTKDAEKKAEKLIKKVYKSNGTNTVVSYVFPSTLISQRCFLPIWGVAKYILMDSKTAISWKTNRILSFT